VTVNITTFATQSTTTSPQISIMKHLEKRKIPKQTPQLTTQTFSRQITCILPQ
jgi:hypothetical protein